MTSRLGGSTNLTFKRLIVYLLKNSMSWSLISSNFLAAATIFCDFPIFAGSNDLLVATIFDDFLAATSSNILTASLPPSSATFYMTIASNHSLAAIIGNYMPLAPLLNQAHDLLLL
jgi:hypothetical protein